MHSKTEIIGRLGKEPESRFTPSGQQVTSFSVATDHKYTNGAGEKVKETTWFRVSVWGSMAATCAQYLHKGSLVFVEGRLISDKATGNPKTFTKQDGTTGANFDITAQTVRFLSPSAQGESHAEAEAVDTEDIPF